MCLLGRLSLTCAVLCRAAVGVASKSPTNLQGNPPRLTLRAPRQHERTWAIESHSMAYSIGSGADVIELAVRCYVHFALAHTVPIRAPSYADHQAKTITHLSRFRPYSTQPSRSPGPHPSPSWDRGESCLLSARRMPGRSAPRGTMPSQSVKSCQPSTHRSSQEQRSRQLTIAKVINPNVANTAAII